MNAAWAGGAALRVTVCELPEGPALAGYWSALVDHVRAAGSDLVVLPETPFHPWLAREPEFDRRSWAAAVAAHDEWLAGLAELGGAGVVSSRPVQYAGRRRNEAFVWSAGQGYRPLHTKNRLPAEDGYWETVWFEPGPEEPVRVSDHAGTRLAALICSELWYFERARAAGEFGVHLLATPRATSAGWTDRWLVAGRAAAICAGAFSVSSNRVTYAPGGRAAYAGPADFGGCGWIIDPDGDLLGYTSPDEPFLTRTIDLGRAERAKETYPRNLVSADRPVPSK